MPARAIRHVLLHTACTGLTGRPRSARGSAPALLERPLPVVHLGRGRALEARAEHTAAGAAAQTAAPEPRRLRTPEHPARLADGTQASLRVRVAAKQVLLHICGRTRAPHEHNARSCTPSLRAHACTMTPQTRRRERIAAPTYQQRCDSSHPRPQTRPATRMSHVQRRFRTSNAGRQTHHTGLHAKSQRTTQGHEDTRREDTDTDRHTDTDTDTRPLRTRTLAEPCCCCGGARCAAGAAGSGPPRTAARDSSASSRCAVRTQRVNAQTTASGGGTHTCADLQLRALALGELRMALKLLHARLQGPRALEGAALQRRAGGAASAHRRIDAEQLRTERQKASRVQYLEGSHRVCARRCCDGRVASGLRPRLNAATAAARLAASCVRAHG